MRTIQQVEKDIATIEALMQMGSKKEIAKLSKMRDICNIAMSIIATANSDFLAKQLDDVTVKYSKYLFDKKELAKIEYVDYRKAKQAELEKAFKPDVLVHQIKFLNYVLGTADLLDNDLLTSLKGVSATGKHAAKVNPI
jgi:chemotaxis protein CheY-P-specific phosphatase CheC